MMDAADARHAIGQRNRPRKLINGLKSGLGLKRRLL
jgi:hypothetical protein